MNKNVNKIYTMASELTHEDFKELYRLMTTHMKSVQAMQRQQIKRSVRIGDKVTLDISGFAPADQRKAEGKVFVVSDIRKTRASVEYRYFDGVLASRYTVPISCLVPVK